MRCCIIGYGRAGKIQFEASSHINDIEIVYIVEQSDSVFESFCKDNFVNVKFETSFKKILNDTSIEAVIVTTPTTTHFEICKDALLHGKNVFVEKPIALNFNDIHALYALAEEKNVLLFTALNRRYDPQWSKLKKDIGDQYPFCINVICRDHPFPPKIYLQSCGGIFRDAAIHDLDMLCRLVQDTPVSVDARLDSEAETSSVILMFAKGCRVHMIHSRHSESYEQTVTVVLSKSTLIMNSNDELKMTFQERYKQSYILQMQDFCNRVKQKSFEPNIVLKHAQMLEKLLEACDLSASIEKIVPVSH